MNSDRDLQLPASYRRMVLFRVETLILLGIAFELLLIIGGAYSARIGGILMAGLTLILIAVWLTWKQHYTVSAALILSIVLLLALGLAWLGQGLHDIALLIFPANLVLGGLLLRRRGYWFLTAATLLTVTMLGVAEAQQWIKPSLRFVGTPELRYEVLTLLVILLLISAMVNMLVQGIVVFFAETQQKSQAVEALYRKLQVEVDERRLAEKALQVLNSELEQRIQLRTQELQNSNRELESFSYSVSHDLRAPLRSIHGFATTIKDEHGGQLPDDAHHLLDRVLNASLRMEQLIADLLRFAQVSRTALRDESIHTQALVRELVAELSEQRQFSGQIEIGELPDCRGDLGLLRQVWVNLIGNAMKFSHQQTSPHIQISAQSERARLLFSIRDNGVGFDMQFHDKLFGVFHRLHAREQFEGTGIGLALCRRIVERHGGGIDANGEVDKGAVFQFWLPLKND